MPRKSKRPEWERGSVLTHAGVSKTCAEWASEVHILPIALKRRLQRGKSMAEALTVERRYRPSSLASKVARAGGSYEMVRMRMKRRGMSLDEALA